MVRRTNRRTDSAAAPGSIVRVEGRNADRGEASRVRANHSRRSARREPKSVVAASQLEKGRDKLGSRAADADRLQRKSTSRCVARRTEAANKLAGTKRRGRYNRALFLVAALRVLFFEPPRAPRKCGNELNHHGTTDTTENAEKKKSRGAEDWNTNPRISLALLASLAVHSSIFSLFQLPFRTELPIWKNFVL